MFNVQTHAVRYKLTNSAHDASIAHDVGIGEDSQVTEVLDVCFGQLGGRLWDLHLFHCLISLKLNGRGAFHRRHHALN